MKKVISVLIAAVLVTAQVTSFTACSKNTNDTKSEEQAQVSNSQPVNDNQTTDKDTSGAQTGDTTRSDDTAQSDDTDQTAATAQFGDVLDFHTDDQAAYLAVDYKLYKAYANGTEEKSIPNPTVLTLSADRNGETVALSLNEDMTDAKTATVTDGRASFYNLLLGETYYYQVGDDEVRSFVSSKSAPRNLYVDGVTNVRDLGGWSTADGGTVRQGMIYRCAKLTASETGEAMITEAGIVTMRDELGIKTEIDLRTVDDNEYGGITASVLGDGVTYMSLPIESGGNIILLNKDELKDIFAVFGDESNYPIAFHCSIGTDRTGMIAFLINGLMGVSEDDLYRDFLFSNFGEIGKMRAPSIIKTYMDTAEMAKGANLSEKIYNYLVDAGVASSDLDSLMSIMEDSDNE